MGKLITLFEANTYQSQYNTDKSKLAKTSVPVIQKQINDKQKDISTETDIDAKKVKQAELKVLQDKLSAAKKSIPLRDSIESDEQLINETSGQIKSFAKKSGKSVETVEKKWNDTLKKVKANPKYKKLKEKDIWPIVVAIVKKRLKIEDGAAAAAAAPVAGTGGNAAISTSTMGGSSISTQNAAGKISNIPAPFGSSAIYAPKMGAILKHKKPKLTVFKMKQPKKIKVHEHIEYIDSLIEE